MDLVLEAMFFFFFSEVDGLCFAHLSGDPSSPNADIGPLCSDFHRRRVHDIVMRAQLAGAYVHCGGTIPKVLPIIPRTELIVT